MSRTPEPTEVFATVREGAAADVRVAIPGRVVRWDAAKQQVDVQPCVKGRYKDEDDQQVVEKLPVIPNVPVCFPSGGGYSFTFPLTNGDYVLVVFSDVSLDKWLSVGGDVDPEDDRTHNLTDAVAIPGVRPFSAPLASVGSKARVGRDGGTFQEVALGKNLDDFIGTIPDPTPGVTLIAWLKTVATFITTLGFGGGNPPAPLPNAPLKSGTVEVSE